MYASGTLIIDKADTIEVGEVGYAIHFVPDEGASWSIMLGTRGDPVAADVLIGRVIGKLQELRGMAVRDSVAQAHAEADALEGLATG